MIKPNFSFKYDGSLFDANVHELESGVTVTVNKNEYEKFDAVEWMLYFENTSEKNSGIFNDFSHDVYLLLS